MPVAKVVHVTSAHPAIDVRVFRKQCRTLAAAGYDVVLVVPHDRDETVDGVRIRAVAPSRGRLERMTRTARRVVRAAAAEAAQIYHLHDPELLFWSLPLWRRGGRVVYDMHEDFPKQILNKTWLPPWTRGPLSRIAGAAERVLMPGLPVVLAEASYGWDRPWLRRAVTVLNMPLADELLAITEPKHAVFTAGYLGTVSPDRGAILMLDAVEILARQGRHLEFECLGPIHPECRAEVMERAARVTALPARVDGQRVIASEAWRRIARCHVGLAMLKNIPNNYAIQPTKLFEYMALSMPVIASNFPEYRAVIEDNGCGLCVPVTPEAVAEAIAWVMDHPDEARAMGERGRDAVRRRFSWDREAEKLLRFYDNLLTSTRRDDVLRRAGP